MLYLLVQKNDVIIRLYNNGAIPFDCHPPPWLRNLPIDSLKALLLGYAIFPWTALKPSSLVMQSSHRQP